MGETVQYEGYRIRSLPRHVEEWQKWAIRITISLSSPDDTKTREFSGDVLYASEKEADVQGIAFGRRVIDGKVPGQSVEDLKRMERRTTPRFRVQFRATFTGGAKNEGMGVLLDLSLKGARVESAQRPNPDSPLELRIHVPGQEWPIMVDGALVQWVKGQIFGLVFYEMKQGEQERLGNVIASLGKHEV